MNQCHNTLNSDAFTIQTGHPIINSLLSDKNQTAKKQKINIVFDGFISFDVMEPVDLCIIFGNLVDNAIEACQIIPDNQEKTIHISARNVKDMFFLTSTNPTLHDVKILSDNTVATTKENMSIHGIGLYSIRSVVQKYNGHMQLHYNNHVFTVRLDFVIPTGGKMKKEEGNLIQIG